MKLEAYLRETGQSKRGFAKRCGLHVQTIHQITKGCGITARTAEKVILATGGMISLHDLVGDRWVEKDAAQGNVEGR